MNRFYCHRCCNVMQSNDATESCPVCNEGFIEPIEREPINTTSLLDVFRIMFITEIKNDGDEEDTDDDIANLWNTVEMRITANDNELLHETLEFARESNMVNPLDLFNLLTVTLNDTIDNYPEITPQGPLPASKDYVKILHNNSFKLKSKDLNELSRGDCIICQDKYKLQITCVALPCKHTYHIKCISKWFKTHNTCPMCRNPVPTDNKAYNLLNKLEIR